MNMPFNAFEYELPTFASVFPDFQVVASEIEIEGNSVSVRLQHKYQHSVWLEGLVNAIEKEAKVYVEDQFKPEHGHDLDYTQLLVNDQIIFQVSNWTEQLHVKDGQEFQLTYDQAFDMNKVLEEKCQELIRG